MSSLIVLTGCASTSRQGASSFQENRSIVSTPVGPVQDATKPQQAETDTNEAASSTLESGESSAADSASPEPVEIDPEEKKTILSEFIKGLLLEKRDQYEAAGDAFSSAFKRYPTSPYLAYKTGSSLLNSNKVDQAIDIASQTIRSTTEDLQLHRVLGEAYQKRKEWDKAIEEFEYLHSRDPRSVDALIELAALYVRTSDYEKALEAYQKLVQLEPRQSFLFQFKSAVLLTQLGRFEDAIREYQAVIQQIPEYSDVYYRLAKLQEIQGRPDEAIETYLKSLQYVRQPDEEVSVRKQLGALYRSRGSLREAEYQYSKIKSLRPDDIESSRILAIIYYEQKEYDKSLLETEALLKQFPGNYRLNALRREILIETAQSREAYRGFIDGFELALKTNLGDDLDLYLLELIDHDNLSQLTVYDQIGRLEEIVRQGITEYPMKPRFKFALANIALFRNNQDAIDQSKRSIIESLQKTLETQDLGWAYDLCKEFRLWYRVRNSLQLTASVQLSDFFDRWLEVYPTDLEFLRTACLMHMDQWNWAKAEELLLVAKHSIEVNNPNYKDVLFKLALIYDKMNRIADIETLMREAIDVFPNDPEPYNFLGYTYADRNINLEEALSLIEKAYKMSPNDGNIIDSLGWVYFRLGRNEEAIRYLTKANEKQENHPVILDHLADVLSQEGKLHEAIEYWKKALQCGPDFPYEFTPQFESNIKDKIKEAEKQLIN